MRLARLLASALITVIIVIESGNAQTTNATASENQATINRCPVEIVSHRIGVEYYPLLDRPSSLSPSTAAEIGDLPPTENERLIRQRNRSLKNTAAPIAPEDRRSGGRPRSYTRVIDDAQLVQVVLKNTDS